MSMQQKQQETLEHIYMSLKSLLTILQDLRTETSNLIDKITDDIGQVIEKGTSPSMITHKTMIGVLKATPITVNTENWEVVKRSRELNEDLIDQLFRNKHNQDIVEFNESLVKRWIKIVLRRIEISTNEQAIRLYNYIDKLFELLGSAKKIIVAEEEEEKKRKEKKEEEEEKKGKEKKSKIPMLGEEGETNG